VHVLRRVLKNPVDLVRRQAGLLARACLSIIKAAIAATCGAGEVPKKFGNLSGPVEPGIVAVVSE
jgi:hypothetical protein